MRQVSRGRRVLLSWPPESHLSLPQVSSLHGCYPTQRSRVPYVAVQLQSLKKCLAQAPILERMNARASKGKSILRIGTLRGFLRVALFSGSRMA